MSNSTLRDRLSKFWKNLHWIKFQRKQTLTLNSSLRDLFDLVQTYQPVQIGDYYKPGWWVKWSKADQMNYIRDLGISDIQFRDKSFLEVGCAEGYACFYVEEQGASYIVASDGHGWKYGTAEPDPWIKPHPQNMMLIFELLKLLKGSQVVRLVIDVEAPNFVDSIQRLGISKFDIVLCAGVIYHNYNPITAMRNIYLVTGEQAIFNIPDFRDWQKDGKAFTPYPNLPQDNDFNYTQVLKYGQSNNRFWNLAPEEWASMLNFAGFREVKLDKRGRVTVFYCTV